jgi:outer membrane biogenesis lipoprotein LolB
MLRIVAICVSLLLVACGTTTKEVKRASAEPPQSPWQPLKQRVGGGYMNRPTTSSSPP